MVQDIANFQFHLQCPTVNGVIFPDGKIQLFDITVNYCTPINYKISKDTETSINSLNEQGELNWNSCTALVSITNENNSFKVTAGEGNWGDDGFVSVIDLTTNRILWIAFFTCSTPFYQVKIVDGQVYAKSTLDYIWKFDVQNPVNFSVDHLHSSL
ncbi:hypothetical protein [Mucilaginibacter auburnensis]|uniref:Uncharacterized protein n=1 Tax=Mucilaginibacter auburnensis TaxID=1457233 RepID=A0A2H9VVK9_9SPHI|nr:hypothetical protein [Mucilaginibacter auburnensis]PJJ84873.1 hypothetical protein CLV57_1895 [Mucilaginibacter auburnensis]